MSRGALRYHGGELFEADGLSVLSEASDISFESAFPRPLALRRNNPEAMEEDNKPLPFYSVTGIRIYNPTRTQGRNNATLQPKEDDEFFPPLTCQRMAKPSLPTQHITTMLPTVAETNYPIRRRRLGLLRQMPSEAKLKEHNRKHMAWAELRRASRSKAKHPVKSTVMINRIANRIIDRMDNFAAKMQRWRKERRARMDERNKNRKKYFRTSADTFEAAFTHKLKLDDTDDDDAGLRPARVAASQAEEPMDWTKSKPSINDFPLPQPGPRKSIDSGKDLSMYY